MQFNESVSGLSNGSAVEYSGLKIGEVERLELQANPNIVNAYIKVQEGVEIQSDVRAMISMVGITGQSMIALSGGTKTSGRLIGTRDNRAIIYATPSPLSQLFSSGEGLVSSMSESLIGVKKLLSDENIESLGQILANVEAITATVADESDNIQSVIREAEGLLSSANAAVDVFAEFSSSVAN
ncbi:MCE family protein [Oligella ureolytica]